MKPLGGGSERISTSRERPSATAGTVSHQKALLRQRKGNEGRAQAEQARSEPERWSGEHDSVGSPAAVAVVSVFFAAAVPSQASLLGTVRGFGGAAADASAGRVRLTSPRYMNGVSDATSASTDGHGQESG